MNRSLFYKMGAALVFCLILAGCNFFQRPLVQRSQTSITQAEAEQLLQLAIQYAQAQDLEKLCGLTWRTQPDTFCARQQPFFGGWQAMPKDPPRIIQSYTTTGPPTHSMAGRVLVLEGVDGLGRPYVTEFIVQSVPEPDALTPRLGVFLPFYWSGLKNTPDIVTIDPTTGARGQVAPAAPPPTPTP